jgi:hypothetical protein
VEKLALFCNPATGGTLQALQLHCAEAKSKIFLNPAYLKTALTLSPTLVIPQNNRRY